MKATESPWDSKVFGVKVGTLSFSANAFFTESNVSSHEIDLVPARIAEANRGSFDVVFAKTDSWIDPRVGVVAVDWRYDMEMTPNPDEDAPDAIPMEPSEDIVELAAQALSGISRFARDPKLKTRAGEFYREWCRSTPNRLYGLEGEERNGFVIVSSNPDGAWRIELVAIAEKARGKRIGSRLLSGVFQTIGPEDTWRVRVSAPNWRALRFYEWLGFRVKSVSTAFHVWAR